MTLIFKYISISTNSKATSEYWNKPSGADRTVLIHEDSILRIAKNNLLTIGYGKC